MKIAVVTGASSGIGREFALQIDRREALDEIWLIARRRDRLEELSAQLRARVRVVALDLLDPASPASNPVPPTPPASLTVAGDLSFQLRPPPRAFHRRTPARSAAALKTVRNPRSG